MKEIFSPTGIHCQLSNRIQALRMKRGWSQETLAEIAHVHRNYIGIVERIQVNVGLAHLEKIAIAFDMPLHELLNMQTQDQQFGYEPLDH